MGNIIVTRSLQAEPDAVWEILDDFGGIAGWSSGVANAEVTNNITRGVGAERHCDFDAKGKNWANERVTERTDDEMHILIYETNAPMSKFEAHITVKPEGSGSHITFHVDAEMKGGFLGKIMMALMVKGQLKKQVGALLADLDKASSKLVRA